MNREKLQQLSDALHNPNVLPDFPFNMGLSTNCVIGFGFKAGLTDGRGGWVIPPFETREEQLWIVHSNWESTDNTRFGAALRIDYLLENGVPDNWKDQMRGIAPLCYK